GLAPSPPGSQVLPETRQGASLLGIFDPTAADYDVAIVENGSLAGGERALRLVEGDSNLVRPCGFRRFNDGRRGLMLVADLHCHPHGLAQLGGRNQIHSVSAESARVKLLVLADDHLPSVILDLNHIERRARGYTESLALADREVVNPGVLADHLAVGRDHLAANVGRYIALLCKIGLEKALVVTAGDEADFLRVGLFGDYEMVLAGEFAHLGLGHAAEWK